MQALEAVAAEMAAMEDKLRETQAQIEPFKEARTAAFASHQASCRLGLGVCAFYDVLLYEYAAPPRAETVFL